MTQETKDARSSAAHALGTLAIHGGQSVDPSTGAVMPTVRLSLRCGRGVRSTLFGPAVVLHPGERCRHVGPPFDRTTARRCLVAVEAGGALPHGGTDVEGGDIEGAGEAIQRSTK